MCAVIPTYVTSLIIVMWAVLSNLLASGSKTPIQSQEPCVGCVCTLWGIQNTLMADSQDVLQCPIFLHMPLVSSKLIY